MMLKMYFAACTYACDHSGNNVEKSTRHSAEILSDPHHMCMNRDVFGAVRTTFRLWFEWYYMREDL